MPPLESILKESWKTKLSNIVLTAITVSIYLSKIMVYSNDGEICLEGENWIASSCRSWCMFIMIIQMNTHATFIYAHTFWVDFNWCMWNTFLAIIIYLFYRWKKLQAYRFQINQIIWAPSYKIIVCSKSKTFCWSNLFDTRMYYRLSVCYH